MNENKILSMVDHTLLKPVSTFAEIKKLCDEGMAHTTASVCIPPCFVKQAKDYVKGTINICTVIGFPNGYATTKTKVFETFDAIENGADEIDMVINVGMVKERRFHDILDEINEIKIACGSKLLKVIIETCLLTEEEIIEMCKIVTEVKAEYIKTSTGFSTGGATLSDIRLMQWHVGENVKIKASGGISSFEDAKALIQAGASRLGTSRLITPEEAY
ncbi:MAG: deoxyribose-phosphate aldolase [Lachnospiraceae bacterium]